LNIESQKSDVGQQIAILLEKKKSLKRKKLDKELLEETVEKRLGIRREFIRTAKTFIIDCILTMEKKLPFDDNILNKSQTIFLDGNFNMTD